MKGEANTLSARILACLPNGAYAGAGIFTGGQPAQSGFALLSSWGIRRIVDLRPRDEDRAFNEAEAAERAQMEYFRIPVGAAPDLTLARARELDGLLKGPSRPTLVLCASSNGVGALFTLRAAWLQGEPLESALVIGRATGLRGLEPAVRAVLLNSGQSL